MIPPPTEEKILQTFEHLLEGQEYTERRKLSDEKGVYLWELEVKVPDGTAEFNYMREGTYPEGSASYNKIYLTYFDDDGFPVGGREVAVYDNGNWKMSS